MRILVAEDDPDMARAVARGLREQAYAVDVASTGDEAMERAGTASYDAILLDAVIPPPDGFEVCRRLRAEGSDVPILMLTARDALNDRVEGLDAGADDYLVKPFELEELLARVRALLRRAAPPESRETLSFADLSLDLGMLEARRGARRIDLSVTEVNL